MLKRELPFLALALKNIQFSVWGFSSHSGESMDCVLGYNAM